MIACWPVFLARASPRSLKDKDKELSSTSTNSCPSHPLSSNMEELPPFDENLLLEYDVDTLVRYIRASPVSKDSLAVYFLSPGLVAKGNKIKSIKDSLKAMEKAHELGVRVPEIRRVIEWKRRGYIVMERIDGLNLHDCWHKIGWITTLRLAWQLRGFVRRMRAISSPTAGCLISGEVKSVWVDEDSYGLPPHASSESVAAFFNFWGNFVPPWLRDHPKPFRHYNRVFFPPDEPLVFTHQDLAPRNLLLNGSNQLVLVDWDFSGWFPTYFEYVSMQNFWTPAQWRWPDKLRWHIFSWISVGCFKLQRYALNHTRNMSLRFAIARKDEVLKEGAGMNDTHLRKPGR